MSTVKSTSKIVQDIFDTSYPSWWKRDGNTFQLLTSYAIELNELYTNVNLLDLAVSVETAGGSDLDDLGKLFKLARNEDETDDQFRARIKGYWNAFTGGGTNAGIVDAISFSTDIPETDITVDEQTSYFIILNIDYAEALTEWTAEDDANNLTLDNVTFFQGAGSLNFDANTGTDITVRKTYVAAKDFSLYSEKIFSVDIDIPNLTNFTRVQVKFVDGSANFSTFYNTDVINTGWTNVKFDLSQTPDAVSGTLDWTDIEQINITIIYSGAVAYTDFRVDWLRFESLDFNMRIKIIIEIDESFDLSLLNNVSETVIQAKAAGIYFGGDSDITLNSKDDLFLVNLSDVNGNDTTL